MLNQIMCVGRLQEIKNTNKKVVITLSVNRNYKNEQGIYETDLISCELYGDVAKNTLEYVKVGDVVGVKGRMANLTGKKLTIVAERITFLTSKKED